MNEAGTGAAFRERSNLAGLITTALIYPLTLFLIFMDTEPSPNKLIWMISGAIGLQIGATILLNIVASISTRQEPDDERVQAIERQGSRVSGLILNLGVTLTIGWLIFQSIMNPPELLEFSGSPLSTAYVLMAALVVAELASYITRAIAYRRS